MKQEKLTPAQQVFINEMVNGASQKQAYMAAYPGSSAEAAYSSASRLMDKPLIREKIEAEKEEMNWMKQQVLLRHKSERLVAITMQQQALARIISGEWTKTKMITEKGKTRIIKCDPDPNLCLGASRLDYKLTLEYNKIMAGMNNKEILTAIWQQSPIASSQYVPFPEVEQGGAEYREHFDEDPFLQEDEIVAFLSKNSPRQDGAAGLSTDDLGKADLLSMANDQDNETCGNSCEILANCSVADEECEETPEVGCVKKAPVQENRHMNRSQRRAAEQKRKRLAEKEEKLRILTNS